MNVEIVNEEIKIKKANKFLDFAAKPSLVVLNRKSKITRDKFLKLILQNQKTEIRSLEGQRLNLHGGGERRGGEVVIAFFSFSMTLPTPATAEYCVAPPRGQVLRSRGYGVDAIICLWISR